jgi:hypothetical protein
MRRLRPLVLGASWLAGAAGVHAQEPPPPEPPPELMPPDLRPEPEPEPEPGPSPAPGPSGGANEEIFATLPALDLPRIDAGTLALGSTFQIIGASFTTASSGRLSDDVDNESATFALALDTRYFQSLEQRTWGWSLLASAADRFDRAPAGDGSLYTNTLALAGAPEGRFYPTAGSLFFLHAAADLNTSVQSVKQTGTVEASDSIAPGSVGVAVGAGFGRVLAIDPVVRLRRLEQALVARGALSGPISEETGSAIVRTWYALRNDIGTYRTLAYTMKHLAEGGLLAGDPDLRSTYEALQILADPFIVGRRHGWDVRGGLGVVQPFVGYDDMDEPDASFALLGSAQLERPLDTTRQLSVRAKLFADLGDAEEAQRPYSLRVFGAYTQVYYADTYDPLGSLALAADAGATGTRIDVPGFPEPDLGLDVNASVAYSRLLNRGSLATGALSGQLRNDGVYSITLSLGITWGVATGFFTPYTPAAAGI